VLWLWPWVYHYGSARCVVSLRGASRALSHSHNLGLTRISTSRIIIIFIYI